MLTRPHLATKLTYWSNATAFVHPIPLVLQRCLA